MVETERGDSCLGGAVRRYGTEKGKVGWGRKLKIAGDRARRERAREGQKWKFDTVWLGRGLGKRVGLEKVNGFD